MRTNTQKVYKLVPAKKAFISNAMKTANLIVDQQLNDAGLNDELLEEIETYLAAHFAVKNPKVKNELGIESNGKGLDSTEYGQAALNLDVTNTLKVEGNFGFWVL